ncbi:uncharacterized protein LOC124285649 [Haliotis rubra]|uniref:uncharacterized protein LOC124285649 n=1 Tax=Haliotis rubra TaxID=36100 RepID=UPI001EE58EC1|nr:uncharacterized protein LOC124285649 [Haliotis rubra]
MNTVLCLFALVASCCGNASRDLAKLHTEFFAWQMADSPMSATYRDIHKYNDKIQSYNISMFDIRKDQMVSFHNRLEAIPQTDLSKSDLVNYKILDDMLTTYIRGWEWRHFQSLSPVNFLEGPQSYIESMVQSLPFFTLGDFENYIVRLQKFPQQYEEFKELMLEAVRLNRTYHLHSLSRVEGQFDKLQMVANESQFFWPFTDTLENNTDISLQKKNDLRDRGVDAVSGLLQALADLWLFIEEEYMPNTRPDIGISSLDGGREFYEACIRWYLSVDMTAQEVHDIGLREVDRIVGNMQKIMTKQEFGGSVREYFQTIMNNTDFFFDTAEDILAEFRHQIFDVIEPTLEDFFVNLPGLPLEVREMPNDGPGGSYSTGSADGSRPGIFWANVLRPHESPTLTMMALSIHEANPGHHLQLSYAITSDTPDFRQKMLSSALFNVPFGFPRYTSFVEGWALYTEYLGEEMKLYRDDYELMGRYSSEIFRACRLVVDTGIHAFNWTREEAIDYMLNYTAESYDNTAVEIDRYITWPGQALAYKIGEIKILELRRKAEETLGSKFDIREFHSVVLESGTVPLNVLEDLVTDWLDTYPVTTPRPVTPTCGAANNVPMYISSLVSLYLSVYMYI